MIQPDQFKDIQDKIIETTRSAAPSTPACLSLSGMSAKHTGSISLDIIIKKGGEWVRKAVEIGTDVARSDWVRQVIAADVVTQAAAGAAVGAGIAIAIPFSIIGLGTGAAIGATVVTLRHLTK